MDGFTGITTKASTASSEMALRQSSNRRSMLETVRHKSGQKTQLWGGIKPRTVRLDKNQRLESPQVWQIRVRPKHGKNLSRPCRYGKPILTNNRMLAQNTGRSSFGKETSSVGNLSEQCLVLFHQIQVVCQILIVSPVAIERHS